MKKLSFIIVAAIAFASCNVSVENKDNKETKETATSEPQSTEPKIAGKIDPFCGMTKDDTWTEFSVSNSDTTWFCSPHCKESFDKDPAKYLNKKEEDKKG